MKIKLNLAFIEDWWYEIASAITKNDPTHEVLMKKFDEDKPNFEWLFIKILILESFNQRKLEKEKKSFLSSKIL